MYVTLCTLSYQYCHFVPYPDRHIYHKIFVKFRESKKNVLKIVLIIVNINKDENKSLISNQFSPKIIVISYHNHFVPQ